MSGVEVNVPLLRKAVEWVESEAAKPQTEREWVQNYWKSTNGCGTAYCVAGYIASLLGPLDWPLDAPEIASEALGLPVNWWNVTGGEEHLFDSDNTAADIRRIAEEIAGERL